MKPRLPLRWKFLAIAVGNLLLLGVIFLVFIRMELQQEFESFLMATAREKIQAVSRQLTLDLSAAAPEQRDALLERYRETYGVRFLLFDASGRQMAGPGVEIPDEVAERMRRFGPGGPVARRVMGLGPPPFLIVAGEPERYWVGVRTLVPEGGKLARATLVLLSATLWSNPFFFDVEPWLKVFALGLAVTLLCWFPLVRGLTRAISKMTKATAAVAEGHFDVEVESGRGDELGSLGRSIQRMAGRLRDFVQGQKRFLGAVAHELRSPLGRMQVALSILEGRVKQEDRGYVKDLQEDVEMMSGLTTELLIFARSGMRTEPLELVGLNLRQVVERAVEVEAGEAVQVEIDPALQVRGEENFLFRAFSNLIRNAVRYAGDQGRITVSAERRGEQVVVTVADRGPGVPEEALEKVFTPFFRLDAARDRKTGGTGLGLAIVRSCVEACEGSVICRNRQPQGLEMVVTLQKG